MYIRTYICMYICTNMYIRTYVCMYICTNMYIRTYVRIYTHNTYDYVLYIHTYMHWIYVHYKAIRCVCMLRFHCTCTHHFCLFCEVCEIPHQFQMALFRSCRTQGSKVLRELICLPLTYIRICTYVHILACTYTIHVHIDFCVTIIIAVLLQNYWFD